MKVFIFMCGNCYFSGSWIAFVAPEPTDLRAPNTNGRSPLMVARLSNSAGTRTLGPPACLSSR